MTTTVIEVRHDLKTDEITTTEIKRNLEYTTLDKPYSTVYNDLRFVTQSETPIEAYKEAVKEYSLVQEMTSFWNNFKLSSIVAGSESQRLVLTTELPKLESEVTIHGDYKLMSIHTCFKSYELFGENHYIPKRFELEKHKWFVQKEISNMKKELQLDFNLLKTTEFCNQSLGNILFNRTDLKPDNFSESELLALNGLYDKLKHIMTDIDIYYQSGQITMDITLHKQDFTFVLNDLCEWEFNGKVLPQIGKDFDPYTELDFLAKKNLQS